MMKRLFNRSLISYVIIIFIFITITGLILGQFISNYYVLIGMLFILFILLITVLLHLFEKFIRPVQVASNTVEKLIAGNYRARIHHPLNGSIGKLSLQINKLARNLSELSIHEQMQAEQLSTVVDNMESGLVLIDDKGYIHLVNRKFISMFGIEEKEYIGHLYYEAMDTEDIHTTVKETFLYEKNVKRLIRYTNNTNISYIEIVGAPIFDEKGLLRGAVLVFYDITEFKKLENMRKDFVANVSHELRTPITSIAGFAETLMETGMEDEEIRETFLKIIFEESKRMQVLIEDLLILSRLEHDKSHINEIEVNTSEILAEVVPMIEQQAEQKNIQFSVTAEENLIFQADSQRLKQVLINLLTNAISYTPQNGLVKLRVFESENNICFEVSDTGIGIEQQDIPRIFERFYRVDKARSRDTGGTGLGLAITKHIVEAHRGTIKVDSEINKGTTFTVQFPKNK